MIVFVLFGWGCAPRTGPPPDAYLSGGAAVGEPSEVERLDLNGDGALDRWVTAPGFCNVASDCVFSLYVANGTAWTRVGRVRGDLDTVQLLASEHHGFRDIEAVESNMGKSLTVRYGFDGRRYVGLESKVCRVDTTGAREVCDAWAPLDGRPLRPEGWPGLYPHEYAE